MEKKPIQAVPKNKKTCAEAYEKASCVSGFRKKMVYPLLDHTYLPYLSARAINYTLEYGIPSCFLIRVWYTVPAYSPRRLLPLLLQQIGPPHLINSMSSIFTKNWANGNMATPSKKVR